ncbi:MAG: hypothetical protein ABL864_02065 [Terricaulis sp.]
MIACASIFLVAPLALAQQTQSQSFSLNELAAALNSGAPTWSGRGGFAIAPNATAQLQPGAHAVGDVIAEIEVVPVRTARLANSVTVTDDTHGQLIIPAGTPLIALNQLLLGVGGGMPTQYMAGALEWCAVIDTQTFVCISRIDSNNAAFRAIGPSARQWRGPLPTLSEGVVPINARFTRQLVIHQINTDGVVVGRYIESGETRVHGEGLFGPGPFDRAVIDRDNMPNLPFRFRRGADNYVVVEAPQ